MTALGVFNGVTTCPCGRVHDTPLTTRRGHRSGEDDDRYVAATVPWYTVGQFYRLTGVTQGTVRSYLSGRHDDNVHGHRHADGRTWMVHVSQLLAIIRTVEESEGREWRPE